MKQETKARIRVVGRILFLVYLLALVYFLFFAEEYGRRNFFELDYRYNLVPFQEIRSVLDLPRKGGIPLPHF